MTLTTEQLRARAKFWREKAVEAKWESVSIAQDMLLNADAFEELAANREAQPVQVTDEMALVFHRALNDGGIGEADLEEIKIGLRGALCNITAPPAPAVPEVLANLLSIVRSPRALPRRKEWVSGQQHSYVLLENVEAMVEEACRAAMLAAAPEGGNEN